MLTAKVTSKGQITIPKEVRDKLGIQPGEKIGFERKGDVFYIKC
ncbi:MAG: AbrB/MazE/SpoVT family DNA-binding domain-containing protein [Desulfovibrio sp.]|nr:AbrB/MazE/SpoVT family DNA-binding domain-containing protein [Desulfovibrio sp.]